MKKNYLLITFFIGLAATCFGKEVDVAYALKVAKNFYLQNTFQNSGPVTLSLAYECKTNSNVGRSSDGRTIYYVFNVGQNNGFVIVSGEDLVQPILGYNSKGSFISDDMPPSVKVWMDKYKTQIVHVIENVSQTTAAITQKWNNYYNNSPVNAGFSRSTQSVNPLCQTTWNQNPYYNDMCPFDNTAQAYCVTGCVACAMAQIMKYWNYPAQGTGNHSYNNPNYGTLSANFGATTYNWGAMPNAISSDQADVETLMSHCGISVDMHYSPQESGAWVITADANGGACAQNSYTAYFGYNADSIKGLQRSNYSDPDWTNMMYNELNLSRPIEYVGTGPGGGHTWVCDGYDGNGNFHMNWGWGSADDGFYSINSLSPINPGTGGGDGDFNSGEEMVIGIVPSNTTGGGTVNQGSIVINAALTPIGTTVVVGSQFSVTCGIANTGTSDFTGDFAAALFNSDGVFSGFVQEFTNQTLVAQNGYNATFLMDSINVIPGLYYVGVYYKNGSNTYSLINPSTFTNPITIIVTAPYNDIQMYSNDTILPARPQVNQAFDVRVDMLNAGVSNITGYIQADLYTLDGTYVDTIQTLSGTMIAGDYYNLNFHTAGLNVTPGTYYVAFWVYESSWNLVYDQNYPNPVEITIVGQPLSPDVYEPDNSEATAAVLPVNFSGNTATVTTAGSNIHVGNDYDYYKINLPPGTNYSVTPTLQDSKNSAFTNDVVFSYKVNSGSWSDAYANSSGPIFVQNGGDVIFFVADDFLGTIGTYELDLNIISGPDVSITETGLNEIKIFPNPVNDILSVNTGDLKGDYDMQIFNTVGETVDKTNGALNGQLVQTDVSKFASGMYVLRLATSAGIINSKFIVK